MEDTYICISDLAKNFGSTVLNGDAISFYGVSSLYIYVRSSIFLVPKFV